MNEGEFFLLSDIIAWELEHENSLVKELRLICRLTPKPLEKNGREIRDKKLKGM